MPSSSLACCSPSSPYRTVSWLEGTRFSAAHLLFAVATTAYILIVLQFEERDLEQYYSEQYRTYRRRVGLLLPLPRLKKLRQTPAGPDADQFPIR
jgi:hypothetical protein